MDEARTLVLVSYCVKQGGLAMLTKGFIDQQIEIMATALGKHMGKERIIHEITDPYRNEAANDLFKRLMDLLAEGKINEAENLLFEVVKNDLNGDNGYFQVALDFYLKLNGYTDAYLALCNFSKTEIDEGWSEITKLLKI